MFKSRKVLHAKNLILIALFFLLLIQSVLVAQERTAPTSQPFEPFWSAFRRAVLKNDKVAVAKMTKFPLVGDVDVESRAIFLRKYSKIFNKGFRRLVAKGKPYENAVGGYSVVFEDRLYMSFEKDGVTYKLAEIGAYR
jgi:hypothetical protein